ncbi:hypothetical protein BDW72DRAFT_195371 [Aspergillus terricola var. indicus]
MRQDVILETTELTTFRQDSGLICPASRSCHEPDAHRTSKGILKIGGWKATLYLGSATSFTVLILNLAMVCWASFRHSDLDQSVLYSGNCDRAKELGTCVHLLINVLSTFLLSASNFGMQCLSAPTRKDIDRAHANNKWLDIGVHSIRNLWRIPRFRMLLWLSLVLTSVPLHLFYNSTVYSTISSNAYDVYLGNSSFASLTPADVANVSNTWNQTLHLPSAPRLVRMAAELERLTPDDCISAYQTTFLSKYASVVLISDAFNGSTNVLATDTAIDTAIIYVDTASVPRAQEYTGTVPYQWICQDELDKPHDDYNCANLVGSVKSRDEWTVYGYKIDYCLAERTAEKCTLEYSLPLAIVVICVNFVKALLICLAPSLLGDRPLLTIGDGIGSFLRWPDETTEGNCLLTKEIVTRGTGQSAWVRCRSRIRKATRYCVRKLRSIGVPLPDKLHGWAYSAGPTKEPEEPEIKPLRYSATPKQRWTSLSRARWVTCLLTYVASLAVCVGLLSRGLTTMGSTEGIWTSGLAAVSTNTMIQSLDWPRGLIPNVLIANIPQLIYSGLYFMSNSILTTMTLSGEWANLSLHRKGLRVSSRPRGHQRRTHFLSLPLRFGVPLIIISALLHWFMSQSLYLVRIIAYTSIQTRNAAYDTMTLGYSPLAIVIGLCVGMLLPAGLVLLGCQRFKSGMPVAGSCSMAIAAACHPKSQTEEDRANLEYQRLMWGVEAYQEEEVWHCAFSDGKVVKPEDGTEYQ